MLLLEALLLTGVVRFAILFIPFNKIVKIFGRYSKESPEIVSGKEKDIAQKIVWAVLAVSKHTPWESRCLVRALTMQIMLNARNVSSTLYLGIAKDKEKKLIAHAWLRSGTNIITGGDERSSFIQVAKFANYAGRERI